MTNIHLLFQQVGGIAVTQRVRGNALVDARGGCSHVTDPVELPGAHRVERVLPGEQPAPVEHLALGAGNPPPGTQVLEQHRAEHGVAILAALALFDAQRHAGAVDIAHLQRHHLTRPQARAVGHRQGRLILRLAGRRDQACDFLATKHHRQRARFAHRIHLRHCFRAIQCHAKEKPQGGDRAVQRDTGDTALNQVQLIAAQIFSRGRIG